MLKSPGHCMACDIQYSAAYARTMGLRASWVEPRSERHLDRSLAGQVVRRKGNARLEHRKGSPMVVGFEGTKKKAMDPCSYKGKNQRNKTENSQRHNGYVLYVLRSKTGLYGPVL